MDAMKISGSSDTTGGIPSSLLSAIAASAGRHCTSLSCKWNTRANPRVNITQLLHRVMAVMSLVLCGNVYCAQPQGRLPQPPNMIVMLADDFGWGDVGAYWPRDTIDTPNLDKLAVNGLKLLDFHSAASVCAPSRASLLTGRLGLRNGVIRNFGPASVGGLPLTEITLAELFKDGGYQTGMIGKWHLGMNGSYHPLNRGFDSYFGLPYSNDMGCTDHPGFNLPMCQPCAIHSSANTWHDVTPRYTDAHSDVARPVSALSPVNCDRWNDSVPLFDGYDIVEQPVDLRMLADRYADATTKFLGNLEKSRPFLLYVAFAHMHVPQQHGSSFTNSSKKGTVFADTLRELDHLAGSILDEIAKRNLVNDTIVWFTGDNGPWDRKCNLTGSPGPFVGQWQRTAGGGGASMKQTTWEGGHREVSLVSWPGRIVAGSVSNALTSTLDIMPTLASLAGLKLPSDRQFDGKDISGVLLNTTASSASCLEMTLSRYKLTNSGSKVEEAAPSQGDALGHEYLFHPNSGVGQHGALQTVRLGQYKARYVLGSSLDCAGRSVPVSTLQVPQLFDLANDPAESRPLDVDVHTAIVDRAQQLLTAVMLNISRDHTSTADYSKDQSVKPCCDASNVVCRCRLP